MQRIPAIVPIIAVLFFIFSLTSFAFAQKKGVGKGGVPAAIADLQSQINNIPAGPQGPQGIQGPKGDQGDKGDPGEKGDKGDPGLASTVPGPKGDKGDKGDPGEDGKDGAGGSPNYVLLDGKGRMIGNILNFGEIGGSRTNYTRTLMVQIQYVRSSGELINSSVGVHFITGKNAEIIGSEVTPRGDQEIYYSESRCSGQAYMASPLLRGHLQPSVTLHNNLYIVTSDDQQSPAIYSMRRESDYNRGGFDCVPFKGNIIEGLAPVELIDSNVQSTFPLPYSVELSQ